MTCDRPSTARSRVLVIDDDRDGCELLGILLGRAGYDVVTAQTGLRALEEVASRNVDLILLDIHLPDQSGLELLRTIRRTRTSLELPIIMATGCSTSSTVVEALRDGANDYVTKPFDVAITLARIETQLEARRQAEEIRQSGSGALDVGSEIHGYRLVRQIGSGGFAVVYQAEQRSTGQFVAIKVLRPDLDPEQYRRFELEVRLVAQLRHPNIVRLIDSGAFCPSPRSAEGPPTTKPEPGRVVQPGRSQPYMVIEYLEGEPLSGLLKRTGRLSVQSAIDLLLPVIGAMMTANSLGIVHRDLKPANIFLSRGAGGAPHPVVLDFGIAKLMEPEAGMTRGGAFIGTPGYFSPEHVQGYAIDARADQYAIGVILYECMSGRRAFDATRSLPDLATSVARGEIVPLRACAPDVPEEVAQVVQRAICVDREQRYKDLEELGLALSRFASTHVGDQWLRSLPVEGGAPIVKDLSPASTAPTNLPASVVLPATRRLEVASMPEPSVESLVRSNPAAVGRVRALTPPTRRIVEPPGK